MSRGFTLIELVVALTLAALAAALLFDGVRVATRTLERLESRRDEEDLLLAMRLLAQELERARRLSGEADAMRFVAPAPARLDGGMVRFSVDTVSGPGGARLVLSYAREAAGGAPRSAALARHLQLVRFEYLGEPVPGAGARWSERWEAKDGLPRSVRMALWPQGASGAPRLLYFAPRLTGIRPEPPA
jgi:prepilin-type N-terminal cleavage/methylation domain-containing protein